MDCERPNLSALIARGAEGNRSTYARVNRNALKTNVSFRLDFTVFQCPALDIFIFSHDEKRFLAPVSEESVDGVNRW